MHHKLRRLFRFVRSLFVRRQPTPRPHGKSADARWQAMALELAQFITEHGHCRVPANEPRYLALHRWLSAQHRARHNHRLSARRLHALTCLGVTWRPSRQTRARREVKWEAQLAQLRAFKAGSGHTRVPSNDAPLTSLCIWLNNQKTLARRGLLSPKRQAQLHQVMEPSAPAPVEAMPATATAQAA